MTPCLLERRWCRGPHSWVPAFLGPSIACSESRASGSGLRLGTLDTSPSCDECLDLLLISCNASLHHVRKCYCNYICHGEYRTHTHTYAKHQQSAVIRVQKHGIIIYSKFQYKYIVIIQFYIRIRCLYRILTVQKINLQMEQKIRGMLMSYNWISRGLTRSTLDGRITREPPALPDKLDVLR